MTIACPTCGQPVQTSSRSARAKCHTCGDVFETPAVAGGAVPAGAVSVAEKVCRDCGEDLSRAKRVKDAEGNYFCPACWQTRVVVSQAQPVNMAEVAPTDPGFHCSVCGQACNAENVYDQGGTYICHACYAAQQTAAPATAYEPEAQAEQGDWPSEHQSPAVAAPSRHARPKAKKSPMLLIIVVGTVVCIGGGIGAYFVFRDTTPPPAPVEKKVAPKPPVKKDLFDV